MRERECGVIAWLWRGNQLASLVLLTLLYPHLTDPDSQGKRTPVLASALGSLAAVLFLLLVVIIGGLIIFRMLRSRLVTVFHFLWEIIVHTGIYYVFLILKIDVVEFGY